MGMRSYVPALGRFLSPDPIPGGSASAYDYAGQDPVNNFDLTGECYVTRRPSPGKCKKSDMITTRQELVHKIRQIARRLHIHLPPVGNNICTAPACTSGWGGGGGGGLPGPIKDMAHAVASAMQREFAKNLAAAKNSISLVVNGFRTKVGQETKGCVTGALGGWAESRGLAADPYGGTELAGLYVGLRCALGAQGLSK
jgi:hypothetical protein